MCVRLWIALVLVSLPALMCALVNNGWEAGFGHLEGIPVGIVGNQGNISRAGAQKAAHFIEVQTSDAQQMAGHASNAAAVYPH